MYAKKWTNSSVYLPLALSHCPEQHSLVSRERPPGAHQGDGRLQTKTSARAGPGASSPTPRGSSRAATVRAATSGQVDKRRMLASAQALGWLLDQNSLASPRRFCARMPARVAALRRNWKAAFNVDERTRWLADGTNPRLASVHRVWAYLRGPQARRAEVSTVGQERQRLRRSRAPVTSGMKTTSCGSTARRGPLRTARTLPCPIPAWPRTSRRGSRRRCSRKAGAIPFPNPARFRRSKKSWRAGPSRSGRTREQSSSPHRRDMQSRGEGPRGRGTFQRRLWISLTRKRAKECSTRTLAPLFDLGEQPGGCVSDLDELILDVLLGNEISRLALGCS